MPVVLYITRIHPWFQGFSGLCGEIHLLLVPRGKMCSTQQSQRTQQVGDRQVSAPSAWAVKADGAL
jgi:hypothetical protein